MTCTLCGYEELDVHKIHKLLLTYCQQCGNETSEKRESRPDRWTDEEKKLRLIQGEGRPSIPRNAASPQSKRKKKRRG